MKNAQNTRLVTLPKNGSQFTLLAIFLFASAIRTESLVAQESNLVANRCFFDKQLVAPSEPNEFSKKVNSIVDRYEKDYLKSFDKPAGRVNGYKHEKALSSARKKALRNISRIKFSSRRRVLKVTSQYLTLGPPIYEFGAFRFISDAIVSNPKIEGLRSGSLLESQESLVATEKKTAQLLRADGDLYFGLAPPSIVKLIPQDESAFSKHLTTLFGEFEAALDKLDEESTVQRNDVFFSEMKKANDSLLKIQTELKYPIVDIRPTEERGIYKVVVNETDFEFGSMLKPQFNVVEIALPRDQAKEIGPEWSLVVSPEIRFDVKNTHDFLRTKYSVGGMPLSIGFSDHPKIRFEKRKAP